MNLGLKLIAPMKSEAIKSQFRLIIGCFLVCFLTHCGSPVVPLGGIVGNGQKPEKPSPHEDTPFDTTNEPLVAPFHPKKILGEQFIVRIPESYQRVGEFSDNFKSRDGHELSFSWIEADAICQPTASFQTQTGFKVNICSEKLAVVEVNHSSSDQATTKHIQVNHVLTTGALKAMLDTLMRTP